MALWPVPKHLNLDLVLVIQRCLGVLEVFSPTDRDEVITMHHDHDVLLRMSEQTGIGPSLYAAVLDQRVGVHS